MEVMIDYFCQQSDNDNDEKVRFIRTRCFMELSSLYVDALLPRANLISIIIIIVKILFRTVHKSTFFRN